MRTLHRLFIGIVIFPFLTAASEPTDATAPELLSFDELVTLSDTQQPTQPLAAKLERLLRTPIVGKEAASAGGPHRPLVGGLGPVLRVVSWNIERGLNFELIQFALSDPGGFLKAALQRGPIEANRQARIDTQLRRLRDADIILLNEVDFGMKRTDYRDVTHDLARALSMNYAFGVEFVEVDRLDDLGIDKMQFEDVDLTQKMSDELQPDPDRYLGLHGNAILSRYPIQNVRIIRLPVCHDWYTTEKAEISRLERGKRIASDKLFLQRIEREVRRGGRMAILTDVRIPEVPGGIATIVNVHLENKCKPECRAKQMDALLSQLREIQHPVILGGDLNTTGADGTPTSLRREILERVKNYEFWAAQALRWGTPAALPLTALAPVKYFRNYLDPTSTHVPVVGSNREATLFQHLEHFRFADGNAFDFRGETDRNLHGKGRTLANSNQRSGKGFEPTFTVKRDFGGLVGNYKLDWLLVKPFTPRPRGGAMSYEFAPHFPLTMRALNDAVHGGVSDHAPISVDLPLFEPAGIR